MDLDPPQDAHLMLYAVIMAGGSGTRFWPKSRRDRPKQLLKLAGDRTMIQQTVDRIAPLVPFERILIITGSDQAQATRDQLPELPAANIIAEPCPRDTAPCVGLAAWHVARRTPDATMIIMPADHVIAPAETFLDSIRAAVSVVADEPDSLVTFGIAPTRPETGYGYIERGERITAADPNAPPVFRVVQVREKTDRATSETFLAAGRFAWNSGIFIWKARTILGEIETHRPELAAALARVGKALGTPDESDVIAVEYPRMERVPIDKAVMEKAARVLVLEVAYSWNDVGDWRALAGLIPADAARNSLQGDVVIRDVKDSIVISDDGGLIVALGVEDLIVVQSGKATLVARKDQLDKLKALVESLADSGHAPYL
jgi:mannose-1-phosphate guanylyltransferase